jgi:SP family general alpha glucoside:H+ symporter-like MFS transporter
VLAAGATWLVVLEMKGMSVGNVDRMFEEGVGARESRKWMRG